MNTNLLREDEKQWYQWWASTYYTTNWIAQLFHRLMEARAEKYEFAAQQLEQAAGDNISPTTMRCRATELRRLANG